VLLTHLHPDHAAGLVDPGGEPVFPRAELHVHADELAYWQDDTAWSRATEPNRSYFLAARAQLGAYRDRLHALRPGEVFPGVTWLPLPGHSPGHTAYRLASGDASLMIWGDVVTIQEVQIPRPDTGFFFDLDPVTAAATRHRVLDMAATDRLLVGGMHVHFPGFGRVVRDGTSFRLAPDVWSVWSDDL
jgi:glyoxylase-like metal-dependent hydrolase (beta-lactamase superfamily II)